MRVPPELFKGVTVVSMSSQELSHSSAVIFPGFSPPMTAERSRNKERLEACLAGLCELELLKSRQEHRVLCALSLGYPAVLRRLPRVASDSANGGESDDYADFGLRNVRCTPWGIMASPEQQVAVLNVNPDTRPVDSSCDVVNSQPISDDVLITKQDAIPELIVEQLNLVSLSAHVGTGETEETQFTDPKKQSGGVESLAEMKNYPSHEDFHQPQKVETHINVLIQQRPLPPRPTKPRTSITHDNRAVSVARQSSLSPNEDQQLYKRVSPPGMPVLSRQTQVSEGHTVQGICNLDQEPYPRSGCIEDFPLSYQLFQQNSQQQPRHCHKSRHLLSVNTSHSTFLDYTSCRGLQTHPDSSNNEPDSPQNFHSFSSPTHSKVQQPSIPDEQLVSAEYIPAQPCQASTRTHSHQHSSSHRSSAGTKPYRSTYSPERGYHHQDQQPVVTQIYHTRSKDFSHTKKCRSNLDKGGGMRKPGKKACRSKSENSLQRVPERKYNTVERDGGGSGSGGGGSRRSQSKIKRQQSGRGGYHRWQSTIELSQDEADEPPVLAPKPASSTPNQKEDCSRRTRKTLLTHTSYAYSHYSQHHAHHQQHLEYQLETDQMPVCLTPQAGQGESESSLSEADSADSSSLSSGSDESGGLVWPQALPPQLSLPSPPAPFGAHLQPKAFVKIKASHALKKKILRFRTGSLKVMTTV